jgi:hypothetical protein
MEKAILLVVLAVLTPGLSAEDPDRSPHVMGDVHMAGEVCNGPISKAIADIHQLGNGKNVIEIYDLDGNRVELMEPPRTKTAPTSTGH